MAMSFTEHELNLFTDRTCTSDSRQMRRGKVQIMMSEFYNNGGDEGRLDLFSEFCITTPYSTFRRWIALVVKGVVQLRRAVDVEVEPLRDNAKRRDVALTIDSESLKPDTNPMDLSDPPSYGEHNGNPVIIMSRERYAEITNVPTVEFSNTAMLQEIVSDLRLLAASAVVVDNRSGGEVLINRNAFEKLIKLKLELVKVHAANMKALWDAEQLRDLYGAVFKVLARSKDPRLVGQVKQELAKISNRQR